MQAAYASSVFPDFNLMSSAVLLNFDNIAADRKISLKSAISEGLAQNLDLKISALNPELAQKEVELAQSELKPQADFSMNLALIDEARAEQSFGTQGRLNWLASGTVSQIVMLNLLWQM